MVQKKKKLAKCCSRLRQLLWRKILHIQTIAILIEIFFWHTNVCNLLRDNIRLIIISFTLLFTINYNRRVPSCFLFSSLTIRYYLVCLAACPFLFSVTTSTVSRSRNDLYMLRLHVLSPFDKISIIDTGAYKKNT